MLEGVSAKHSIATFLKQLVRQDRALVRSGLALVGVDV
jgi:hypothetical protein